MNRATQPFQDAKKSVPIVLNIKPKQDVTYIDNHTRYLLDTDYRMNGWRTADNDFEKTMADIIYYHFKYNNRQWGKMKHTNEIAAIMLEKHKRTTHVYIQIYEDRTYVHYIDESEGFLYTTPFTDYDNIKLKSVIRKRKLQLIDQE